MDDVIGVAVELGILKASDTHLVRPDHLSTLAMVVEFVGNDELHSEEVCDTEVGLYEEELVALTDMVELEDCDRVEVGKSFSNDEIAIDIPRFLIPFMRNVVLPAIREQLF